MSVGYVFPNIDKTSLLCYTAALISKNIFMHKKALFTTVGIIAAIIVIIASVFVITTQNQNRKEAEQQREIEKTVEVTKEDASKESDDGIIYNVDGTIDTSNWQTYRNEEYGFELKYPTEWTFGEYPKNNYGTILYITSPKTSTERRGQLNTYGDNVEISIYPFERIKADIEKRSGTSIKTIDELFKLNSSVTEICKLEDIDFFGDQAYIVHTFGATGHSGILINHSQVYYLILFEGRVTSQNLVNNDIVQKKCFAQNEESGKYDFGSELMPEENAILQSFYFDK